MKKNPKMIAGIAALVVLAGALVWMLTLDIPMAGEVRREMSLTPTPLPPPPASLLAVTPDPSKPTPAPELRYKSEGTEVENLQRRLQELGYYSGAIDGKFFDETLIAVRAFQEANGLAADGIVGEKTREALYSGNAVHRQN